jgi:hypothetical protein
VAAAATAVFAGATPTGTAIAAIACAIVVNQTCTISPQGVAGNPQGAAVKLATGMTFNVTATAPPNAVASTPTIFITTTRGVEDNFACTPVSGPGQVTTCTGTTLGDILQGGTVSVRFAAPGAAGPPAGTVTLTGIALGSGLAGAIVEPPAPPPPPGLPPAVAQVAIPAVPRPPVQFIPSAPAPLLPPVGTLPSLRGQAPLQYPEVPVIPEADTLALVVGGLAALAAVAAFRRRNS